MLEAFAIVLFIIYVAKKAKEDTGRAWRSSRDAYLKSADKRFPDMPAGKRAAHAAKHDAGWGLSQLGHGFPATRNGFMTGWHESRQAHHQAMLGRQEAKTRNLEARAGAVGQLQDYRARQQAALEQIRSGKASGTPVVHDADTVEPEEVGTEEEVAPEGSSPQQFPVLLTAHSKSGRKLNPITGGDTERIAVWDQEDLDRRLAAAEQDPDIETTVEPAPGMREAAEPEGPASPGDTTVTEDHWDDPLPGEEGSAAPEEGTPEGTSSSTPETSPTSTESTEGTTMAADTSYDQIYSGMSRDRDDAETAAAEQQQRANQLEEAASNAQAALGWTNATIDAASGLDLDGGTSAALMDHAEAQRDAAQKSAEAHESALASVAAHQHAMETAQAAQDTLQANHGLHNEAHQNSPVGSAQAEFYAA